MPEKCAAPPEKKAHKNKLAASFKDQAKKTDIKYAPGILPSIEDMKPDLPGIYCDCYGTLFSHSMEKDELLVAYLNARYVSGTPVTLASSAPRDVLPHIRNIGLHEDILHSLRDKLYLSGDMMETLIDDEPGFLMAQKIWRPNDPAFRQHMQDYLATQNAATPTSPEPTAL